MNTDAETLLALEDAPLRQNWIRASFPAPNSALVQALRDESNRRVRNDPHTAFIVAQALSDAAEVWHDEPTRAVALLVEGNIRRLLSEHETAVSLYEAAAERYRSLGLTLEAAHARIGQIDALLYLSRYDEAIALADDVIQKFRDAGEQQALGKALMNRGNIFSRRGEHERARQDYGEARAVFLDLGDKPYLAMVNANDANLLSDRNDFVQATRLLEEAQGYFVEAKMANAAAQVEHNLACIHFAQGDFHSALHSFSHAREAFVVQNAEVDIAYVDLYRSEIYLALNLWQESLAVAQSVRNTFEQSAMFWEAGRLRLNEAMALSRLERMDESDKVLDQAHQLFLQEKNNLWLAMTLLYRAVFMLRRRQPALASDYATQALQSFQSTGLHNRAAQCEIILGDVALSRADLDVAASHFTAALTLGAEQFPGIGFACHHGLGRIRQQKGDLPGAIRHYEQAVSDIERLQLTIGAEDYKIAFRADKLRVYEELVLLYIQTADSKNIRQAFSTVERAKSRALLDMLATDKPKEQPTSNTAHLSELQTLQRELNWYYDRLFATVAPLQSQPDEQKKLVAEISAREQALKHWLKRLRDPDLAAAPRNPIGAVTPEQVQAMLPANTLLVELFSAENRIVVFGISKKSLWHREWDVTASQLADLLAQMRFQMDRCKQGGAFLQRHYAILCQTTNHHLNQLYDALLQPIEDMLVREAVSEIIFVPHGILYQVPFHALFDGARHLSERFAIAYIPSATLLHTLESRPAEMPDEPPIIIGVEDPALSYIQTEVNALLALFPTAALHYGPDAIAAQFLDHSKLPAFLHISSHATFRADNPAYSALKLADRWVTANDIAEMSAVAPLVTLSACETGQTQVLIGDEIMGLCRSFFAAGAETLAVSSWQVDDVATAHLMTAFYRQLQQGQPAIQALRSAQLEIKQTYPHPYYWSSFSVVGNPWLKLIATA
jgi:CHAT domain-containing protein/Flp pilus assembly protein TadD